MWAGIWIVSVLVSMLILIESLILILGLGGGWGSAIHYQLSAIRPDWVPVANVDLCGYTLGSAVILSTLILPACLSA
jgi:hypothetical protein